MKHAALLSPRRARQREADAMARILVVDDQAEVAELVQAMLADAGHAVPAVHSGQAPSTS